MYCCATADILTKLLKQCFLFFIVVVIPGHNLVNSQVSVNRTIGPTLVYYMLGGHVFLVIGLSLLFLQRAYQNHSLL